CLPEAPFEAAPVFPPPGLLQPAGHHLVDDDLVLALSGRAVLPQPLGRRAGVGRQAAELLGQLVGDGTKQLAPVRSPLVVVQRHQDVDEVHESARRTFSAGSHGSSGRGGPAGNSTQMGSPGLTSPPARTTAMTPALKQTLCPRRALVAAISPARTPSSCA